MDVDIGNLSQQDLLKLAKKIQQEQKKRETTMSRKLHVTDPGISECVSAIKAAAQQNGVRAVEVIDASLRAMKLGYDLKQKARDAAQNAEGDEAAPRRGRRPKEQ